MKELYTGHGWQIFRETAALPDGRLKTSSRLHACDTVHILAFPDEDHILLLEEFRPFYKSFIFMIPSGNADKEDSLEDAARRELQEETGFEPGSLQHFATTRHKESLNFESHSYIAKDLRPNPLPQDESELIRVHTCSPEEALEKVLQSPVIHTPSAFALLLYLRKKKQA